MNTRRIILLAAVALGTVACSDDSSSKSDATSAANEATTTAAASDTTGAPGTTGAPATADATLLLSDSSLGQILTTADGMTLYLFTPDGSGPSTCTGGCATAWPPFTEEAVAGEGLDSLLLGTVTRDDGSLQVTYGGHPLYLFSGDAAPGDVNGQGSGGVWFAVNAAGEQVG